MPVALVVLGAVVACPVLLLSLAGLVILVRSSRGPVVARSRRVLAVRPTSLGHDDAPSASWAGALPPEWSRALRS